MTTPKYEVTVGNIGSVYRGDDEEEAKKTFAEYDWQAANDYGRAAGEEVCLWVDGEPAMLRMADER